jgi:hypothetical protein
VRVNKDKIKTSISMISMATVRRCLIFSNPYEKNKITLLHS